MLRNSLSRWALVFVLLTIQINYVSACTIITTVQDDTVLFGNNEDYTNPNTYYWVTPSNDGLYSALFFGFDNFWPQGGINEMGLVFDINALPQTPLTPHPELHELDNYEGYIILQNCATVEDAVDLLREYNFGEAMWGQIHIADADGNAVVVSAGPDGELTFTKNDVGNGIFISTNFNLANNPQNERDGLCWRYDRAVEVFQGYGNETLTVDSVKSVLDAVHVEGAYSNTLYSNVYDLVNRIVYVYYFHQYDEVIKLNVSSELTETEEPVLLRTLFSEDTVKKASDEQSNYRFIDTVVNFVKIISIVGLLIIVYFVIKRVRG